MLPTVIKQLKSMNDQRLVELLEKELSGAATDAEKKELDEWYRRNSERQAVWDMESPDEETELENRMLANLQQHMRMQQAPAKIRTLRPLLRVAAVVTACFFMAGAYFYLRRGNGGEPQKYGAIEARVNNAANRYVILPDSSVVILHPGSNISYHFSDKTRELNLEGEAFFDIRHDARHPFLIHTGAVTTTVLGTAFNIRAYKGQSVTVIVTRGKVSVSGGGATKVLAVLTPKQQVEVKQVKNVREQTKVVSQQTVENNPQPEWVKADMQFDELPFTQLVDKLESRYDVKISLKNPALGNCPITGRFSGTETLDQVLQIITSTTSTKYFKDGDKFVIDGTACIK